MDVEREEDVEEEKSDNIPSFSFLVYVVSKQRSKKQNNNHEISYVVYYQLICK